MFNIALFPLVLVTGAVTANLTELVRGESSEYHPSLAVSTTTMTSAITAYVVVWFALLISGIDISSDTSLAIGIEYLAFFMLGLVIYTVLKGGRFVSDSLQTFIYRISFPLVLLTSFLAIQYA